MPATAAASVVRPAARTVLIVETIIVLGITLGRSAIYSILQIIEKLTRPEPLGQQTTQMNPSYVPDRPWLDLAYQIAGFVLPLVPVVLCIYLMTHVHRPSANPRRFVGFDFARPWRDFVLGFAMAAAIGVPGLGFYLVARAIGINTNVAPANITENWWTVPVYIGFAIMNGVLEEVIVVAYLFTRWSQAGLSMGKIIVISAIVRGAYHLYQGFGGFIGNIIMGLVFGWVYARTKRVMPLVIAHTLIDIVAFVGYALLAGVVSWL